MKKIAVLFAIAFAFTMAVVADLAPVAFTYPELASASDSTSC